ncbi:MAG TPA: fumarylacetoacetate hydrolase family protein [Candidatus Thermoplasmatota archaeon]|nr:fumarylacetoacetate hydrolase family protein [Candidatus Thermoplasmatota archaeon]
MPHLTLTTGERVTAGKLVCVGRNYADHAREMGAEAPADPILFLKPASALVPPGGVIVLPKGIGAVHHEVELCVLVGATLKNATPEQALRAVKGYAVGLDMTARDLQAKAKKEGLPWTLAKGIDTFAPMGHFVPAAEVRDPAALELELKVNGETRQRASTKEMIHGVASLLAYTSRYMTLEAGDVIMTGTPAGVGPVKTGDRLVATATGLPTLEVTVRDA